jgi:hypothetical protein
MKLKASFIGLTICAISFVHAQSIATQRGAGHGIWGGDPSNDPRASGLYLSRPAVVELGDSLNYSSNSDWLPSEPVFALVEGGAVASRVPTKVSIAANLNGAGSVSIVTTEGKRFRLSFLGVSYYCPSQKRNMLLAEVQDCIGGLVEPDRIAFRSALDTYQIDVYYDLRRNSFSQNIAA